jgi:mannitol/fructose-specific phosphotransferase system IIA component (Ntr-type)
MPVALTDLLDERQVALGLRATEKSAALREISQLLSAHGKIDDVAGFLQELNIREQARPSIVENGVVFPHLRTDLVDEIVIGIGRSKPGVPFGNGETANLIFLIAVPQRFANEYLIVVGALARLLREESIRQELLRAKSSAQFVQVLQKAA